MSEQEPERKELDELTDKEFISLISSILKQELVNSGCFKRMSFSTKMIIPVLMELDKRQDPKIYGSDFVVSHATESEYNGFLPDPVKHNCPRCGSDDTGTTDDPPYCCYACGTGFYGDQD